MTILERIQEIEKLSAELLELTKSKTGMFDKNGKLIF